MSNHSNPVTKIEVQEEPEIQYAATPELFEEIRAWLLERGGVPKKSSKDHAVYYDTSNYRLLREGIEYRVKQKGDHYRHDMKTPHDTNAREVIPDANDILRRHEIKFKSSATKPSLATFFGQALLMPVQRRVYRLFEKELSPQFASDFLKEKIDHETDCKRSRVEYSLQTGEMTTPDGSLRSETYHILELELREGMDEGLLEEKAALEREFFPKGLQLLDERKIMLGFALLEPNMTAKQRHAFEDARARNRRNAMAGVELGAETRKLAA